MFSNHHVTVLIIGRASTARQGAQLPGHLRSSQLFCCAPKAAPVELGLFFTHSLLRISGLMLMGMALFKLGILKGPRAPRFYGTMVLGILPLGVGIVAYGAWQSFRHDWALEYAMFGGYQYNYWGSLLVALGLLGGVMWIAQRGYLSLVRRWLEPVSQTAFSNYIAQSMIGMGVIYGTGLGLFGSVSRTNQLIFVVGVWILQLALSSWWLTRFHQGPLECRSDQPRAGTPSLS